MALAIVADVGSATANAFVTVAVADLYLEARLNASAWAGTDPKMQAIIEATRELNALAWVGYRVNDTQALAWPRRVAPNPDASNGGYDETWTLRSYFAETVIPQRVQDACCELALEFLRLGTTDLAAASKTMGVIEKTIDVITTKYAAPSQQATGLQRYPRIWTLIAPLLATGTSAVRLTR